MLKPFFVLFIITFAVVFFAFRGLFGKFPDEWQWIGVILAGLGLTMATPSIFQMFWGRPCVKTEFEVSAHNDERSLVLFVQNPPVKNRLLKMLGVKREGVQSLSAELRISEFGSKKVISPIRRTRIYCGEDNDNGVNRIELPPTYSVGGAIMVAMWDKQKNQALILGDRIRQPLRLGEGYYLAQIILIVDGEPTELIRQFAVGKTGDELIWAKPPQSTSRKEDSQTK